MKKKPVFLISVFITLLLLAALAFPACARAASFSDVRSGDWYYDAVRYVDANGLMVGESAARFAPEGDVTRAMIVTVLYRLEGAPALAEPCPFRDVAAGTWYAAGVTWAAANDIVSGYSDGRFGPEDVMTREQTAAVFYRYARYKGYDLSDGADLSAFVDAGDIHDWAVDALSWSSAAGLIKGMDGGRLEPEGRLSRAQAAAILTRFDQNIALPQAETVAVPILSYHHIADYASDTVITAKMLERHFAALRRAGYHAVFLSELRDYVLYGADLPDKPVVVTFDDGYLSNYSLAFPLLKKYDLKADIFIIGVSFGKSTYKDTSFAIDPHFGAAEAAEMLGSGRVELGSHTYDLHQSRLYEAGPGVRESLRMLSGDTKESYMALVREDARQFAAFYQQALGGETDLFSYPRGVVTEAAAQVLREEGYTVTVTTVKGVNTVIRGRPRSLESLRRFNVSGDMTAEQVLEMIGE